MLPRVIPHKHNGVDMDRTEYTDLSILPETEILPPTGGAVVDAEARATLNSILTLLQNKRLME